jgi:hypothetical protein
VVNRTTADAQTPIFRELNAELGELPEIVVPDFDWHGFEPGNTTADDQRAAPESGPAKRGGRRRRKD